LHDPDIFNFYRKVGEVYGFDTQRLNCWTQQEWKAEQGRKLAEEAAAEEEELREWDGLKAAAAVGAAAVMAKSEDVAADDDLAGAVAPVDQDLGDMAWDLFSGGWFKRGFKPPEQEELVLQRKERQSKEPAPTTAPPRAAADVVQSEAADDDSAYAARESAFAPGEQNLGDMARDLFTGGWFARGFKPPDQCELERQRKTAEESWTQAVSDLDGATKRAAQFTTEKVIPATAAGAEATAEAAMLAGGALWKVAPNKEQTATAVAGGAVVVGGAVAATAAVTAAAAAATAAATAAAAAAPVVLPGIALFGAVSLASGGAEPKGRKFYKGGQFKPGGGRAPKGGGYY